MVPSTHVAGRAPMGSVLQMETTSMWYRRSGTEAVAWASGSRHWKKVFSAQGGRGAENPSEQGGSEQGGMEQVEDR